MSLAALAAGAVIAAVPATAWAHAEFQGNSSVPANSDQKLTLNVPEEKGPSVHNTKVVIRGPVRFLGVRVRPEASVEVRRGAGQPAGARLVTYTRESGDDPDGNFSFGVHTPGPGGLPLRRPTRPTATTARRGGTARPTRTTRHPSSRST